MRASQVITHVALPSEGGVAEWTGAAMSRGLSMHPGVMSVQALTMPERRSADDALECSHFFNI